MSDEVYAVSEKGVKTVIVADYLLENGYTFEEVVEIVGIDGPTMEDRVDTLRLLMYMAHENLIIDPDELEDE